MYSHQIIFFKLQVFLVDFLSCFVSIWFKSSLFFLSAAHLKLEHVLVTRTDSPEITFLYLCLIYMISGEYILEVLRLNSLTSNVYHLYQAQVEERKKHYKIQYDI